MRKRGLVDLQWALMKPKHLIQFPLEIIPGIESGNKQMSNLTKPCSASRHQTTARLVYRRLLCVVTPRESHMTHPGDSQDTQTGSMETNSSSCEFPWAKLSTCTTNAVKHAVAATHTLSLDPPVLNLSKAASVFCTSPLCKVSCTAVGNFEAIEMEKSA